MTTAPPEAQVQPINGDAEMYEDYWGTDEVHKHYLPDGKQYFEFTIMNEGDKAKFQRQTNQDISIGRDGSGKVRMDPATERHTLIKTSVVGWNLMQKAPDGTFSPMPWAPRNLDLWLEKALP